MYPPSDAGSTGLAAGKVLKLRGFASSYRHAFGLQATLAALQHSPVLLGISWPELFFKPAPSGELIIGGRIAGGHEILLDEIDVENKRVWLANSWSPSWAISGRAWISWDTLQKMLSDRGDVVIPVAVTS